MSSEVADEWASTTLKEAAGELFTDGDWVESKDQDPDGEVRLIQLADIGDGLFLDKSARFLTADKARELRCTFLRPGDLLIARMADPIARCCLFPGLDQPAATVVDVSIVRPGPDVDREYLAYAISNPAFRSEAIGSASGTTRSRISRSNLGAISLPLPPLDEQRRIAEVLRSVDEAIAAADEVARQWARTFETLLDAAFAEGRPVNLGDICSLIYRYPGFYGFDQLETGVPVIRGEHLRAGRISRDWADYYFVDPAFSARFPKTILELDDVVMSVRGTVGTTAVVDAAHVGSQISPNLIRLVADPAKIVKPLLYYAVQSAVAHMRRTIVNAQALPAINAGDLKQVEIALPPLADQVALLAELNGAAAARADAVSAAQQARQTKAVLMSDLLSGRLRVPV